MMVELVWEAEELTLRPVGARDIASDTREIRDISSMVFAAYVAAVEVVNALRSEILK